MRLLILCTLIFGYYSNSFAQPSFPPPTGVYCSCGPTTGAGFSSVNPAIASKPFVKGILVRVGWDILEPVDDAYNWALIDTQINRARQYGKKISLGIGNGILAPQWLFTGGAQRLVSQMPFNDTLPIPWDAYYLTKWKELVTALGARYQNDTVINLVYITNATANGFEMQLPMSTTPTLAAAGYTDTKMTDSWKEVIDAFSTAFPNHYLTNDFHPVNGSNAVADSVYDYATKTIGNRYGAAAWWWTQKNTTVYPSQYNIMKQSAANNSLSVVQFANSGTADSAKFGPGGMPAALQLAKDDGICYWEIWNDDILNAKFETLLENAACAGVGIQEVETTPEVNIYPNPAEDHLYIATNKPCLSISITSPSGMQVFYSEGKAAGKHTIETEKLARGLYILTIRYAENTYNFKVVLR